MHILRENKSFDTYMYYVHGSPWRTEYCHKWCGQQYFYPGGAYLISVTHKQSVWKKKN